MNRQERMTFIDVEIKGLWSDWRPTEAEIRVWMGLLGSCEYGLSRVALQQCFCGPAGRYRRPQGAAFMEQVKALSASARSVARRSCDPEPKAYIQCIEAPPGKPHLLGRQVPIYVWPPSRQTDPAYVLACAEHAAAKHARLYTGRWIVLHPARLRMPRWHPATEA